MKKVILCALAAIAVFGSCFAQTTPASDKDTEFQNNSAKVDMLYFFLPLAMTKTQLREILPVIEKYRADCVKIKKAESTEMAELNAEVQAAVKAGLEEGKAPSNELRTKISTLFKKFDLRRTINDQVHANNLLEVCMKVWNNGQKKVAAQSLDPKSVDSTLKPDQMKEEDKIRVFIEQFMMSQAAYEVLCKLSI